MNKLDPKLEKVLQKNYGKKNVQLALQKVLYKQDLAEVATIREEAQNLEFNFTNELKTLSITNQKSSGRCWIFAGLNVLREIIAKKYNLASFELSQNYVAFYDKFEKINYFLESIDSFLTCDKDDRTLVHILKTGIQDGGQFDMFVGIVEKYGIVPKSNMIETFSSSNTGFVNRVINTKLRQYVANVRSNPTNIAEYKQKTLDQLYTLLCTVYGTPPQKFDWEFKDKDNKYQLIPNLTPLSYYKQEIGDALTDCVSIINSPTEDKPFYKTFTVSFLGNLVEKQVKYLNLPIEELKELVIKQIEAGEVVWFGSDVSRYGDRTLGTWNDGQYAFEELVGVDLALSKSDQLDYCQSSMNHAMLITGFTKVGSKITKWKIQNSWGPDRGEKGYFICSDSWFDLFVYQAVIHKKYLSDKQQNSWDTEEPIVLKPWDPMGSLAD
jgi:bleomycin hydrolase